MAKRRKSNLSKVLRGVDSRAKARVDEALIGLRKLYESMDKDDKRVLKEWIEQVISIRQNPAVGLLQSTLHVELRYDLGPGTFRSKGVPPIAIKNAIDHWDQGEHYAPVMFGELGLG